MSWTCPHQKNEHCDLRQCGCNPGAEGCAINKRVRFVGDDTGKPCDLSVPKEEQKRSALK